MSKYYTVICNRNIYWVRMPNRSNLFFVVDQIDSKFFPLKKVVCQIDPKIMAVVLGMVISEVPSIFYKK